MTEHHLSLEDVRNLLNVICVGIILGGIIDEDIYFENGEVLGVKGTDFSDGKVILDNNIST